MNFLTKVHTFATTITFFVVLSVAAAVVWEWQKPVSEYFTHYGNLTVKEVVTTEDDLGGSIEVYGFGTVRPNINILITNQLWCVSADSVSRQWVLIGTVYTKSYDALNALPAGMAAEPITATNPQSALGSGNRKHLADISNRGWLLKTWNLGELAPAATSSCYINADWSTETRIFRLTKRISFRSVEFTYMVPDSVVY